MDEQLNIGLATEELKDMLQYGHLELADKTVDPGYIQHNPNVPQGRKGFTQFMAELRRGWRPGRDQTPVEESSGVNLGRRALCPDDVEC